MITRMIVKSSGERVGILANFLRAMARAFRDLENSRNFYRERKSRMARFAVPDGSPSSPRGD